MAEFINENPERTSVYIIKNDSIILKKNIHKNMCLASTIKWIVLLEYFNQIEKKVIDKNRLIDTLDLSQYYMPNTNGGAHLSWIDKLKKDKKINKGKVPLYEVTRGMILYSSNACTEYMTDLLGIENVNNVLRQFDIKNHEKLFYLSSYNYLMISTDSLKLKKMPNSEIVEKTILIHNKVKSNKIKLNKEFDFTPEKMDLASRKFSKSTVEEYAKLLQKINSKQYVSEKFKQEISYIFKPVNTKNKKRFKEVWTKGGSSASILTNAFYAQTINGDRYYIACFLNNLEFDEYFFLSKALNDFNRNLMTNKENQKEYIDLINSPIIK
jgi:D-alanyl-D-alanine carboxypeptidase